MMLDNFFKSFPDKWLLFIVLLIGLALYIYRPNEFVQNIVQTVIGALIGMLIGRNNPNQQLTATTGEGDLSIVTAPSGVGMSPANKEDK